MEILLLSLGEFIGKAGSVLLNLLIFIVVLGLIIGLHELGHMFFALRAGVLCREYAIGMGPRLWSRKKGETVYSLRAFPIGGFCSIAGETTESDPFKDKKEIKLDIREGVIKGFYLDVTENQKDRYYRDFPVYKIVSYDIYDEANTGNLYMEAERDGVVNVFKVDPQAIVYHKKEAIQIAPYNRTLGAKTKRQRCMVLFGGPLMNFVLALLVFLIVGFLNGFPDKKSNELGGVVESVAVIVDDVSENPHVFRKGDRITKMSVSDSDTGRKFEEEIKTWSDIEKYMDDYKKEYRDKPIDITFQGKNGEDEVVKVMPFTAVNNAGFAGSPFIREEIGEYEGVRYLKGRIGDDVIVSNFADISSEGLGDNSGLKINDKIIRVTYKNETKENPKWTDISRIFGDFKGDEKKEENNLIHIIAERKVMVISSDDVCSGLKEIYEEIVKEKTGDLFDDDEKKMFCDLWDDAFLKVKESEVKLETGKKVSLYNIPLDEILLAYDKKIAEKDKEAKTSISRWQKIADRKAKSMDDLVNMLLKFKEMERLITKRDTLRELRREIEARFSYQAISKKKALDAGFEEGETVLPKIAITVKPYSRYLMENQTSIGGGEVEIIETVIGIIPRSEFNFFRSFGYAFKRTWESLLAVVNTFKLLFRGSVSVKNLSGPIGIYSITAEATRYGFLYVMSLLGLLSVNIGALNLLPIPALDGGRLVFLGYEAITKKKPNPKAETILILITMLLLLILMVFVTFGDVKRLFGK